MPCVMFASPENVVLIKFLPDIVVKHSLPPYLKKVGKKPTKINLILFIITYIVIHNSTCGDFSFSWKCALNCIF